MAHETVRSPYARSQLRMTRLADLEALRSSYTITEVNSQYQLRVNQVLDLFPTSSKYHNIETGERGVYPSSPLHELKGFLDKQLTMAREKPGKTGKTRDFPGKCLFCNGQAEPQRMMCSDCKTRSILELLWSG